MKNNKGFTLVELMAVVIILVFLSLMSIALVSKISERSRIQAFLKEANTFAKAGLNKYYEDKLLDPHSRDDIYHGEVDGKVCYSIHDNLLDKYVVKDKSSKYSGSVEVCYKEGCTYQTKIWFTNGKKYYVNGKSKLNDESVIEHSTSEEFFDSCGHDSIGSYSGSTTIAEFDYLGSEETIKILKPGVYRLEAWGAQGGIQAPLYGGYGSYSTVEVELKKGDVLYINVGGQGESECSSGCKGGYNGGGSSPAGWSSGGGATSISLESGTIDKLSTSGNLKKLLLVASGGGGTKTNEQGYYPHGMGVCPNDWWCARYSTGSAKSGSAGGGGYYGFSSERLGNGGISYISNPRVKNGYNYCYKCIESTNASTKTFSTSNMSAYAKSNVVKIGDGYAKITYLANYRLAYNLNGGTLGNNTNPQTYSSETDTFTLSNPTKFGYTFAGWSESVNIFKPASSPYKSGYYITSDGSEIQDNGYLIFQRNIEPNSKYIIVNSGTFLNPGYAIYDENGNVLSGSNYNKTKSIVFTTPNNASYIRFSVGSSNERANFRLEKIYENLTIQSGSTGNKTFTAYYKPVIYTISYNLDGGVLSNGVNNPTSYNIENPTITLSNPTKSGHKFLGWTGSNGTVSQTSVSINNGSSGNKQYTAVYEKEINMTFDYNISDYTFATAADAIMNTGLIFDYDEDFVINITFNLPVSSRRYLLIGNFGTSKNLNLEVTTDNRLRVFQDGDRTSNPLITIGEDINCVLNYTSSNKNVTYSYSSNSSSGTIGGTFGASGYTGAALRLGQDYRGGTTFTGYTLKGLKITQKTAPSKFPSIVTLPNYSFDGWYTSPTGGTLVTASNMSSYENQTIYAHWTANS